MIKYEPHIKRQLDALPSGKLRYTLKNDYMFKAVLQKNQTALAGLLSALLKIPVSQIESITILNPIELGKSYDAKDCMLDIKLKLNNARIINIELQVAAQDDWPERSLTYLCRSFDQTQRGGNYGDILPTVHISILDFSLKHLTPEFFSEFMVCNTKNHEVYSDKFILYVLNLTVIEDDTIIKEPLDLYQWALLFKATTWEELKMLAEENTYIGNTIVTLHELTEDEKIRQQYEARERYEWDMASATATGLRKGREEGFVQGKQEGFVQGKQEGFTQGKQEGFTQGKQEGQLQLLIQMICRKLQKHKTPEMISEDLEEDLALVQQICHVAEKFAPDYNADEIYAAYQEEYNNQQSPIL